MITLPVMSAFSATAPEMPHSIKRAKRVARSFFMDWVPPCLIFTHRRLHRRRMVRDWVIHKRTISCLVIVA